MGNIPTNCVVCEHTKSCESYYDGLGCRFNVEIEKTAIQRFWDWIMSNKR